MSSSQKITTMYHIFKKNSCWVAGVTFSRAISQTFPSNRFPVSFYENDLSPFLCGSRNPLMTNKDICAQQFCKILYSFYLTFFHFKKKIRGMAQIYTFSSKKQISLSVTQLFQYFQSVIVCVFINPSLHCCYTLLKIIKGETSHFRSLWRQIKNSNRSRIFMTWAMHCAKKTTSNDK